MSNSTALSLTLFISYLWHPPLTLLHSLLQALLLLTSLTPEFISLSFPCLLHRKSLPLVLTHYFTQYDPVYSSGLTSHSFFFLKFWEENNSPYSKNTSYFPIFNICSLMTQLLMTNPTMPSLSIKIITIKKREKEGWWHG